MLLHYYTFIKRLDKGLRLQILEENPEFLASYTFKLLGKNLNLRGPSGHQY